MQLLTHPDPALTTRCVLVPTMGSLHQGHEILIERAIDYAKSHGNRCVVSIFVNPTQFNEQSDFDQYPRDLDADARICKRLGVDVVFAPETEVMYPPDRSVPVPTLPAAAEGPELEDTHRPGHFEGVCQVVARLFDLCRPSAATFGEKDWQQLTVVRQMSDELPRPVEIVPVATVREDDELALSSRNLLLSKAARKQAVGISEALIEAGNARTSKEAERVMAEVLADRGIDPEYAVVRDALTLLKPGAGDCRALIAAKVGGVRLIDNMRWPTPKADGD